MIFGMIMTNTAIRRVWRLEDVMLIVVITV